MSSRLEKIFANGNLPLIVSEVCGAPDMAESQKRIQTLIDSGCDIINLVIPFSDPMADGAVIQQAAQQALSNGADLQKILQMIKLIRQNDPDCALVISGYANVFLQYTWEKLFAELAQYSIDGIIITDMPFEERAEIAAFLQKYQIPLIVDTGLTADEARLRKITAGAQGFIIAGNPEKLDFIADIAPVPVVTAFVGKGDGLLIKTGTVTLPADELPEFIQNCQKSLRDA